MKKKVLSVILSTAMIASVLAGCGGGRSAGNRFCGRRGGRDYLDVLG